MTAFKNKRCTQCTAYGNIWHDFNVPYGALYGISDGIPYVVTENYAHTLVRVWVLSGENWIVLNDKVSFVVGTSKQPCLIHATIVEKCKAWCQAHKAEPRYKTFRESDTHKLVGVSHCLPKDRNPQRDYLYKAIGRPARIESRNNHAILFDASQDKPIIRSECYWETGKNDASTSHKKPAAEKPLWENPTKNWGRKGAIK